LIEVRYKHLSVNYAGAMYEKYYMGFSRVNKYEMKSTVVQQIQLPTNQNVLNKKTMEESENGRKAS